MNILISGCNSLVGIALSERLTRGGHRVLAYDLEGGRLPSGVDFIQGDVRNFRRFAAAASGCDAGVHLAVLAGRAPAAEILSVNVLGAYGFMSAARSAPFRVAVLASSAPVHLPPGPSDDALLLPTSEQRDHAYDLSKTLQEVIGRDFHAHGVPVMCLRFGHIVLGAEQMNVDRTRSLQDEDYCRGGWVALEDVTDACTAALTLTPAGKAYEVLNIVGAAGARARFQVADAEERLGIRLAYDFAAYETP